MRLIVSLLVCAAAAFASGELSGRRAPGFSLPDSTGRQHDPQDYRGKILLVEFMQTTCPHCAAFSGVLEQVVAKYQGKVAVLSIVVMPDTQANVQRYINAHKVTNAILFDCGQVAASYYRVTPQNPTVEFPHVFIVDPQGNIRNDHGYSTQTRDVFEGKGLFTELDRMLAGGGKK